MTTTPVVTAETTVGSIAVKHPLATRVFARHNIDFCCGGGKPLAEVCTRLGLDIETVLDQIHQELATSDNPQHRWDQAPLGDLIDHILATYHRPLDEELPRLEAMARKVNTVHGDKDPEGTVRRNERQWSGVSAEELAIISRRMDLSRPLEAATLGANLCVEGIPDFSQLPRGTRLRFPSGAVLVVEESNPPCADMAEEIAAAYTTSTGEPADRMFPKHSMGLRGVVGVIDVGGRIQAGDRIVIEIP